MKGIQFEGFWINRSHEIIKFLGPLPGEIYNLESNFQDGEFISFEKVRITKTDAEYAKLDDSVKFGSGEIIIRDMDHIEICGNPFKRILPKSF